MNRRLSPLRAAAVVLVTGGALASAAACSAASGENEGVAGAGGSSGGASGSSGTAGTGVGGFGGSAATDGSSFGGFGGTASGGSGGSVIDDACASIPSQATNTVRPIDVIWAVDTSDSMVNELQAVEANLNNFYTAIGGLDVRVVMLGGLGDPTDTSGFLNPDAGFCIDPPLGGGGCPNSDSPGTMGNFMHYDIGVGSTNALQKFIDSYPTYKPFLRQNSVKYFSVVTDDESDMDAATFTSSVAALDLGWFDVWKFFGIYCTGSCGTFLACSATGNVYTQLITQTGGVSGDLCGSQQDFAPVFQQLAQSVVDATTLDCQWVIPPAPPGETFEQNKVNVEYTPSGGGGKQQVFHVPTLADCGPTGGWYYDDNTTPTKILLCPASCSTIQSDLNAKVDVLFGCFTIDVPK